MVNHLVKSVQRTLSGKPHRRWIRDTEEWTEFKSVKLQRWQRTEYIGRDWLISPVTHWKLIATNVASDCVQLTYNYAHCTTKWKNCTRPRLLSDTFTFECRSLLHVQVPDVQTWVAVYNEEDARPTPTPTDDSHRPTRLRSIGPHHQWSFCITTVHRTDTVTCSVNQSINQFISILVARGPDRSYIQLK